MARVCVAQSAVRGMDHQGVRYLAKDGVMTVPDDVARHLIRHDECFPAADKPRAVGFVCGTCGFATYFRACSRCGGECTRPEPKETSHAPSE